MYQPNLSTDQTQTFFLYQLVMENSSHEAEGVLLMKHFSGDMEVQVIFLAAYLSSLDLIEPKT